MPLLSKVIDEKLVTDELTEVEFPENSIYIHAVDLPRMKKTILNFVELDLVDSRMMKYSSNIS